LAKAIDRRLRCATSVLERESFLDSIREKLDLRMAVPEQEEPSLPLTWAEVQEMNRSGWVRFGSHTMHHPILGFLKDFAEVEYEVMKSRALLQDQLKKPIRTFAYPVGQPEHIGRSSIKAVEKAGYEWAVTTVEGFNSPQTDPFFLHSHVVDVGQHWLIVAAKTSGLWSIFSQYHRIWRRGLVCVKASVQFFASRTSEQGS
jgi:hypothetical protein